MASVGVIGGGAFGTAMACVARRAGHAVTLWAREEEVVAGIECHRVNALFLPGVVLPEGVRATGDLAAAVAGRDFLISAVPAQHVRAIATRIRPNLAPGTPLVSCSKGIERGSCALMPEVLADALPHAAVAVLSGPSFAREVANDLPCGVVLACADPALCARLADAIATPHFCIHPSADVIGAAIGGVMKNVVAIASGIAAGRKLGENARATVLSLGLDEALRFGLANGAQAETFLGLAGAGDLALTANSLQSRNTALGFALGEGRSFQEIMAGRREVTEGAFSVEAVVTLARRRGVSMPIAEAIDRVLNHGADLASTIVSWMAGERILGPGARR